MFDGVLKIVRSWGDGVDRDALLEAAKALVALVIGASGVHGDSVNQLRGRGDFITGAALLQNVGCMGDARYLASAAVFAVAAALQCHFDPSNCKEDAVRHSLTALFLSGQHRAVLPSVAKATELKPFVEPLRELDLDRTAEQVALIGAAFGIEAPLKFATQLLEATVVDRAEHIGNGFLGWLLDDTVDVDRIRQEILSGREEEGLIYDILSEASEIPAADEPHAFDVGKIPVFDTLLERARSAMVTGDTTLRTAKARALLEACVGLGQGKRPGTSTRVGWYEFRDICRLKRKHNAALGVVSACIAVLLSANAVDPDVANALVASICAAGWYFILVPSAMECESIKAGIALLEFMCMVPERDRTVAKQAYMMSAAVRNLTGLQLTEEAERLLDEAIAQKAYDPTRRVRESELDRETGVMPETDDGPDEGDRYGANPWWLKDLKELFKKKKKQAARMGPAVHPSKANLSFVAGLATMPLAPVTTKAPPPYDLNAEFEKLFRVPKRRAGAYGDKKKSPAKPREDPTKKTKAKDDNRFSILNESFGGGGGDADTAAARDLFS